MIFQFQSLSQQLLSIIFTETLGIYHGNLGKLTQNIPIAKYFKCIEPSIRFLLLFKCRCEISFLPFYQISFIIYVGCIVLLFYYFVCRLISFCIFFFYTADLRKLNTLGLPFARDLSLENSADSYLCFRLALLHSVSYFFFPVSITFFSFERS